jgi:hypothetical protein
LLGGACIAATAVAAYFLKGNLGVLKDKLGGISLSSLKEFSKGIPSSLLGTIKGLLAHIKIGAKA